MIETTHIIAIVGLVISSLVFFRYALQVNREKLTIDGFTLSDRSLDSKKFGNTFAATSTSLATVIVFFLGTHGLYGCVLFYAVFAYLAGQVLFMFVVRHIDIDFEECRTLADLWFYVFPSRAVARLITSIILVSYVSQLFIEIYIGSVILKILLPMSSYSGIIAFLSLVTLTICYVRFGGYKAIIKTDKWQLYLMLTSVMAILLFAIVLPNHNNSNADFVAKFMEFSADKELLWSFVLCVTIINFLLPITQLSNWQRLAASKSLQSSWRGIIKGLWKTALLWGVPIVGFLIIKAKGYEYYDIAGFLQFVVANHGIISLILFPIMMVGFCSAIFSTADVYIMSIIYSLHDKNTLLSDGNKVTNEANIRKTLNIFSVVLLIIMTILYWVAESSQSSWLMPFTLLLFTQLLIVFPLYCYALYRIHHKKPTLIVNKLNAGVLFMVIVIAWALLFIAFYVSAVSGNPYWTQVAPLGSIGIVALVLFCCTTSIKKRQQAIP